MHPQLADQGFHILHISPLGYAEPNQIHPEMQLPDGNWPVGVYMTRVKKAYAFDKMFAVILVIIAVHI
ncbi:hypothetical protein LEA_03886, partial [human gut metagenome]